MDTHVTLVVGKHPSGYHYVAFDYDPHPTRDAIIKAYYDALIAEGHVLERVDGFNHRANPGNYHPKDFHYKLVSGPRAA